MARPDAKLILVSGATGYVGGRLVPRLLTAGYRVRCLARDPMRLQGRARLGQVEIAQGDVLQPSSLVAAMRGVSVVYYLVHSLGSGGDFSERDLAAARNCANAAKSAGVERIIYLGGLGDPTGELSPHLRSRQETGAALREAGVPVIEFRAAVIVGSGSLSQGEGQTLLLQTAFFEPKGLLGLLYWNALYPVHALIFSGLIRRIGEEAG